MVSHVLLLLLLLLLRLLLLRLLWLEVLACWLRQFEHHCAGYAEARRIQSRPAPCVFRPMGSWPARSICMHR